MTDICLNTAFLNGRRKLLRHGLSRPSARVVVVLIYGAVKYFPWFSHLSDEEKAQAFKEVIKRLTNRKLAGELYESIENHRFESGPPGSMVKELIFSEISGVAQAWSVVSSSKTAIAATTPLPMPTSELRMRQRWRGPLTPEVHQFYQTMLASMFAKP